MGEEKHGYYVEEVEPGVWQSVFPPAEAESGQLHASVEDAIEYMVSLGIPRDQIKEI